MLFRKRTGSAVEDGKEAIPNGLASERVERRVHEKEAGVGEETTGTRLLMDYVGE